IANRSGYRLTPSVVAVAKNGKRLVGALARRQAVTNAERTVVSVKRLMGRKWSSRSTQEALSRLPYTVVPHEKERDDLLIQIGEKQSCVFDLGGGTFDFTVLHMYKGVFEVEATGGDSLLGGDDFDNRVVDWLAQPFLEKHGIDLRKDKMSLQRLRDAGEKAKCELSATQQVEINLPFIATAQGAGPLHLQGTLTRPQLEVLTRDLVDRCLGVCARVLAEAKVKPTELGDVLLVGGQTRMPVIQARVRRLFGREP